MNFRESESQAWLIQVDIFPPVSLYISRPPDAVCLRCYIMYIYWHGVARRCIIAYTTAHMRVSGHVLETYTWSSEIHQTLCIFFTSIFRSPTHTPNIYKGDGIETTNITPHIVRTHLLSNWNISFNFDPNTLKFLICTLLYAMNIF